MSLLNNIISADTALVAVKSNKTSVKYIIYISYMINWYHIELEWIQIPNNSSFEFIILFIIQRFLAKKKNLWLAVQQMQEVRMWGSYEAGALHLLSLNTTSSCSAFFLSFPSSPNSFWTKAHESFFVSQHKSKAEQSTHYQRLWAPTLYQVTHTCLHTHRHAHTHTHTHVCANTQTQKSTLSEVPVPYVCGLSCKSCGASCTPGS